MFYTFLRIVFCCGFARSGLVGLSELCVVSVLCVINFVSFACWSVSCKLVQIWFHCRCGLVCSDTGLARGLGLADQNNTRTSTVGVSIRIR